MSDKSKLGTIVDGIAASEHLDSSGECLSIEGMDISSLGSADSILNFEHNSKQHPAQVCGKVTFAKKIFKKSDCSNDRERYFWDFCKKPFVYVKGELFDHPDLDHDGARNVAALLRYDNRDKGEKARRLISFSIEGGKIEKKGMNVTKSIARDLALTVKHCNKMCIAEIMDDIKERKDLYKREQDQTIPELTGVYRELIPDLKKNQHQDYQEKVEGFKDSKSFKQKEDQAKKITDISVKPTLKSLSVKNNMRKTLIAGMMGGSPDSKTGMAALASEEIVGQKKVKKNEKLEKMSRPVMGFKNLGVEPDHNNIQTIDKEADVLSIDKENPRRIKRTPQADIFAKKAANKIGLKTNPEERQQKKNDMYIKVKEGLHGSVEKKKKPSNGMNMTRIGTTVVNQRGAGASNFPSKHKNVAKKLEDYRVIKDNQEKMKQGMTFSEKKGRPELRGNFPTTTHHEGLHRTLGNLENKYSMDHRQALVEHMLNNFFDRKDLKAIMSRTKNAYGDKNTAEEMLAHMTNLLQQKKYREEDAYKENPVDYKRLGSGWKNAVDFANNLTEKELQSITRKYLTKKNAKNAKNKK